MDVDIDAKMQNTTCLGKMMPVCDKQHLKAVFATFLLICFLSLMESTFETWKNVFYFISKAHSVLEKIKF